MDDLQRHLETILRWKRLVILLGVLGAAIAALLAFTGGGTDYEAESTLVVGASAVQLGRAPEQDADLARGYVSLLNGSLQSTIREAAETPGDVGIGAEAVSGSPFIRIAAAAPDSETAIQSANAFADAFVEHLRETSQKTFDSQLEPARRRLNALNAQIRLDRKRIADAEAGRVTLSVEERNQVETRLARQEPEAAGLQEQLRNLAEATRNPNQVEVFSVAVDSERQSNRILANAVLGLLGGLLLGRLLALFLNALELRLSTPGQVKRRLGLETLATVPAGDPARRVEAYQALANRIALTEQARRTLAVTSPALEEGKSAVARNFARYRAELGDQVVLIDATFSGGGRNGSGPDSDGLAELLQDMDGSVDLGRTLVQSNVENLRLLPAGAMPKDPYSLFSGERMSKVLEEASQYADLVVIDAPPVLKSAESQVICSLADGALLVLDSGSTSTSRASDAREQLDRVQATVLGVVLRDSGRRKIRLRP
jgi:capsular exopolysaccharide synthesis family protein